jgi:hypothetical protein
MESHAFDAMIRQAKWHFMWVQESYSQRGFGTTEDIAIGRALTRALMSIGARFNAAEYDSVETSRFPGFYMAHVTMHARHVQPNTSLEMADSPR